MLTQHAQTQGTTTSVVVRDALSAWLLIEGATHRVSVELDGLREDLRTCLASLESLTARLGGDAPAFISHPMSDRVRARFDHLNHKEEYDHGKGNR